MRHVFGFTAASAVAFLCDNSTLCSPELPRRASKPAVDDAPFPHSHGLRCSSASRLPCFSTSAVTTRGILSTEICTEGCQEKISTYWQQATGLPCKALGIRSSTTPIVSTCLYLQRRPQKHPTDRFRDQWAILVLMSISAVQQIRSATSGERVH